MELVETFLVIFQASVSGLSRSDKEELAVHIIPEVNVVINHAKPPRNIHAAREVTLSRF